MTPTEIVAPERDMPGAMAAATLSGSEMPATHQPDRFTLPDPKAHTTHGRHISFAGFVGNGQVFDFQYQFGIRWLLHIHNNTFRNSDIMIVTVTDSAWFLPAIHRRTT